MGYIVLTRIYERYGGSNSFLVGTFILAINLGFSKYSQPTIIYNGHKGRLYGGDDETRYEKIKRKTTEMVWYHQMIYEKEKSLYKTNYLK